MRRSLDMYGQPKIRRTSQRQKTEPSQVQNNAGGYVYPVDKWEAARRFMIMGTETGSFYRGETELTKEMVNQTARCLRENPIRLAMTAKEIISERSAIRPDYALYVLAGVSLCPDEDARRCVLDDLRTVCNIPSHLFMFLKFRKDLGGRWNRMLRNGVARNFNARHPGQLMYHFLKYKQRYGWSHQDVIRQSHAMAISKEHNELYDLFSDDTFHREDVHAALREPQAYSESRMGNLLRSLMGKYPLFKGYVRLWYTKPTATIAARIVKDHRLTREMIPTPYLKFKTVWDALLKDMPTGALIRNLTNLGSHRVLAEGKPAMIKEVARRLRDPDLMKAAGIHPLQVLQASTEYEKGVGRRGKTWEPVMEVRNALNTAFHNSFDNIIPTFKRLLVAVDTSPSMGHRVPDVPDMAMTSAAGLIAMCFIRSEPHVTLLDFNDDCRLLDINPEDDLQNVIRHIQGLITGGTDCAAPINWAYNWYRRDRSVVYDAFVILTDSETWSGRMGKPYEALQLYRQHVNPKARMVTVQMESNAHTLGAPDDEAVLDCIGFDTAMPTVVTDFLRRDIGETLTEWEQLLVTELASDIPF